MSIQGDDYVQEINFHSQTRYIFQRSPRLTDPENDVEKTNAYSYNKGRKDGKSGERKESGTNPQSPFPSSPIKTPVATLLILAYHNLRNSTGRPEE